MKQTWQEYTDALHDRLDKENLGGLVALEQITIRSNREKLCANCGEPGAVEQQSHLIKSVKTYWFCQTCADYYASK